MTRLLLPLLIAAWMLAPAAAPLRAQAPDQPAGPVHAPPDSSAPVPATTNAASATNGPDPAPGAPPLAPPPGLGGPSGGPNDVSGDIAPPRPPVPLPQPLPWAWIAAGAALLALLAALVMFGLRRRGRTRDRTAYEIALERLEKARGLLDEAEPVPYAALVSETVRQYLGQRFRLPSPFRTTEEFLRLMETEPSAPLAAHRDRLRGFLQACDLVKFARHHPSRAELEQVQQTAVDFVTATRPEPPSA